jgi:hypothetical protein
LEALVIMKTAIKAKLKCSARIKRTTGPTTEARAQAKLIFARCKRADHERMVFIELNRVELGTAGNVPDWVRHVDAELAQAEKDLTVERGPAPTAYVFVTNRGFMHALDSERWNEVGVACGFKIEDFASRTPARSILDLVRAREKHKELHWLRLASMRHNAIPSSFDDRLPEESQLDGSVPRLLIGSSYLVPDQSGNEVLGVLTDAVVNESKREVFGTYKLQNGLQVLVNSPLTEAELAAYKRSPDTFFGVIKKVRDEIQEPLDCYDFFLQTYSQSTREKLLEFVAGWPDYSLLAKLEQKELAEHYCARMAEMMWTTYLRDGGVKNPTVVTPPSPPVLKSAQTTIAP